jgi:CBS-domain-containing membrane protein
VRVVDDVMVTCPKRHAPESGIDEIRALFGDDHVHMALIVDTGGRLVTTIERPDLADTATGTARELGTLAGRTVHPSAALAGTTSALLQSKRRRLAVVDDVGRLLGLLCLKRDGTGYCSDEGVRRRERERTAIGGVPFGA